MGTYLQDLRRIKYCGKRKVAVALNSPREKALATIGEVAVESTYVLQRANSLGQAATYPSIRSSAIDKKEGSLGAQCD